VSLFEQSLFTTKALNPPVEMAAGHQCWAALVLPPRLFEWNSKQPERFTGGGARSNRLLSLGRLRASTAYSRQQDSHRCSDRDGEPMTS